MPFEEISYFNLVESSGWFPWSKHTLKHNSVGKLKSYHTSFVSRSSRFRLLLPKRSWDQKLWIRNLFPPQIRFSLYFIRREAIERIRYLYSWCYAFRNRKEDTNLNQETRENILRTNHKLNRLCPNLNTFHQQKCDQAKKSYLSIDLLSSHWFLWCTTLSWRSWNLINFFRRLDLSVF